MRHARFVLAANLPLRDAEGVTTPLCRLRGADRHLVRRRLLLSVERAGPTTEMGATLERMYAEEGPERASRALVTTEAFE